MNVGPNSPSTFPTFATDIRHIVFPSAISTVLIMQPRWRSSRSTSSIGGFVLDRRDNHEIGRSH